jgi:hypothetical protein
MLKINVSQIKPLIKIPTLSRLTNSGKKNCSHPHIFPVRHLINYSLGSPGKTLMLLKKASKPQRSGFKRKQLPVLGTFKEI